MKIIQVCYRFPPAIGGVENHVYNLSYRLSEKHTVTVFTSDIKNTSGLFKMQKVNKPYEKPSDNLNVFRLTAYPPNIPYAMTYAIIPSLIRNLAKSSADIIHVHGYIALHSDITSIISKLKKIPLVLTVHAYGDRLSNPYKNQLARLYNFTVGKVILNCASKIIVLDPGALKYFSNLEVENKIQIIPNGIEYKKFAKPRLSLDFRQKYNVEGKVVLFVGQLQRRKGVQHLLKSALQIIKEVPDTNFLIVGDGDFKRDLIKISNNLEIKDKVKFVGFLAIEKLLEAYASADIFVLPSALEGLPTVILEAMASGKPVVSTNVGGIPSVVENGVTGFLTNYGDEKGLAEKIIYLLENGDVREKMGESGRKKAENYSWESITEKTEKVYKDVIEGFYD